jgi:hypothetical protein
MKTFLKILKILAGIAFLALIIFSIFTFTKKPVLNRNWTEDARILPDITITDSTLIVKNLRDWRYKQGEVISKEYYEETFDLDKIEKAYFLLNPFGKWEGVGHTFFLFEFEDGKTVSVSVEARRPDGIPYEAVKGLFNNYEMWYAWGSAADLFSRRAVYHNEDLYMYPLNITARTVRGLFVDLAKTTEGLETQAQFYNTITSNCTNVLADSANRVNKGSIPWTFARIFTGYADNKLYDLKLIPHDKPFEQVYEDARIDLTIRSILEEDESLNRDQFWSLLSTQIAVF